MKRLPGRFLRMRQQAGTRHTETALLPQPIKQVPERKRLLMTGRSIQGKR